MGSLEPSTVLAQYGQQIQRTLMHPAPRAKELVLREVCVCVLLHCIPIYITSLVTRCVDQLCVSILKELFNFQLDRAVSGRVEMVERMSAEQDLLVCIIDCLSLEEMSAARYAVSLMKSLGLCPVGLAALYSPLTMQALQAASSKGDIIRFRVYEVSIFSIYIILNSCHFLE